MNTTDNNRTMEELTPLDAMRLLNEDDKAVLLDVRMKIEFDYVGHPPQAINIPWQDAPGQPANPDFVNKVREALKNQGKPEDLTVLTLCRSGGRSRNAAKKLLDNGFTRVINISEGFEGDPDVNRHRGNINGWRFHGLPWVQS